MVSLDCPEEIRGVCVSVDYEERRIRDIDFSLIQYFWVNGSLYTRGHCGSLHIGEKDWEKGLL